VNGTRGIVGVWILSALMTIFSKKISIEHKFDLV